jgi:hypothetical protein
MTNTCSQDNQETECNEPAKSTPAVQNDLTIGAADEPRTPLPKFQLFLILLIQFSEPITAVVIYPFVNQFVRDTGITQGDDRKTGYYAGVIVCDLFVQSAASKLHYNHAMIRFCVSGIGFLFRRSCDSFPVGMVVRPHRPKTSALAWACGSDFCDAEVRVLHDILANGMVTMYARDLQWQYR